MNKIIILGNSAAGIGVAEEIRKADVESKITIISLEESNSYLRTKIFDYMRDGLAFDQIAFKKEDFYSSNKIDLFLNNPVTKIDFEKKRVNLSEGEKLTYDFLVIATGKSFFVPKDLKGHRRENIFKINTLKDADAVKEKLSLNGHVCIWGSDHFAIQLALLAKQKGNDVKLISAKEILMNGRINKAASQVIEEFLISKGIDVILNRGIIEILGNGEVNAVKIDSGKVFAAEAVLVTENLQANIEFLKGTDLEIEEGILVDKRLRTNHEGVFAAGDVVKFKKEDFIKDTYGYGWEESLEQGRIVASNILGQEKRLEHKNSLVYFDFMGCEVDFWGELGCFEGSEQITSRSGYSFRFVNIKENKIAGFILINDSSNKDKFLLWAQNQVDANQVKKFFFENNQNSDINKTLEQKEIVTNA